MKAKLVLHMRAEVELDKWLAVWMAEHINAAGDTGAPGESGVSLEDVFTLEWKESAEVLGE